MKKIQRIISFLLALVMIIGVVSPIEVCAEETDPTQAVMEVTEETTVPAEPETEAAEETTVPTETAAEQTEETAVSNEFFIETLVESSFSEAVNETVTNEAIESGSCGENLTWTLLDGVLTISGEGAMYDYTYTEDDENGDVWTAPWLGLPFTSVVVDEGVTYIGDNAFYRNSLVRDPLETVVLADSVTAVGDYAFYCTEADITMSRNLTSVGQYGFYACSVDQMYQIVDVGRYGFANASFETGNIQAGRTSAFSFASCKGLDTVIFYQNPGSFSFQFADLKRMIVTDDVTVIGEEAFWYCKKLEEIYYCCDFPEIQLSAYAHTPDTMSVYRSSAATGFDDSVAVWPDEAHAQVKGEYVKATCTESGYTVYRCAYCDFSIKQEDGSVGDHIYGEDHQCSCGAIGGTCGENLTWSLLDGVLTISGEGSIPDYSSGGAPWYQYRGDITSVVIESGVIRIGQYAFEECAMSSLTLPESVIQIADPVFVDCNELTDVYISDIAAWVGLRTNNSTDHPLRCNQNEKNLYLNGELLTDAVIPEGVTAIGSGSFYKCTNLRSVTLPASVTTLRYNVFSGCTNLRDVYIEDLTAWLNLDFMSENPLNSNSEPKNLYLNGELLTDIVIPDGVTQIGDYAFFSCSKIRSITFPEGIESIGFNSFAGCSGVSSIILPDSVTYIDVEAFSGCSSLSIIVLPENLSVIEKVAFSDCSSLTEITIPANVTAIWDYAFRDCTDLSRITFEGDAPEFPVDVLPGYSKDSEAFSNVVATAYYPANNSTWTADVLQNYGGDITWIAYEEHVHAFDENNRCECGLIGGTCGENVTWTFNEDTGTLTISGSGDMEGYNSNENTPWSGFADDILSIVVEEGVKSIGTYVFHHCAVLNSVVLPASLTRIEWGAFSHCNSLSCIEIPENVTEIGGSAFYSCVALSSISIPAKVTYIDPDTFACCDNLSGIWVDEANEKYANDTYGVLFNKDMTRLVKYPEGLSGVYTIPNGVITIGSDAFMSSQNLTGVTFSDTVTEISNSGFIGCNSLKNIVIPSVITKIDSMAFAYCASMESITFEGNAPSINDIAFAETVTTAYYPANNPTWTVDVMQDYGGTLTWVAYEPEIEKIVLSGTAMTLGNSLSMDFGINISNLTDNGEGHYALITKYYADGREPVVTRVDRADWKSYSGSVYTASCTGIAAKEMCDEVEIVVYNADGYEVTNTYTDSVKSYAMRTLNNTNNQSRTELLTTIVDMLNYGAAAQQVFGYDTANLANADLTEAQKALATAEINPSDARVKGPGYAGSTLTLESQILLDFVFFDSTIGTDFTGMYAIATYTDHYGNAKEVRMDEFKVYASGYHYVSVSGMAVADCSQLVTCTVYNSNGDAIASASDSVEGYIARQLASGRTDAIYTAILKFAASAYNYFH